jgi:pimeloyl-ACP methyl ester carboxylesterase
MNEQFAQVGDVELCYETFGDPDDTPMLLIMGLSTQMLGWSEDFCRELVSRGFFVIRYDNRDVGRSTHLNSVKPPTIGQILRRRPRPVAYTLDDMADDAVGLLDHLGIESAHVVGASMGGMIAQTVAIRHPERVRSLASIMSNTGSRWSGQASPRIYPIFFKRPPRDREGYVEALIKLYGVIGSPGFEPDLDEVRDLLGRSHDRGVNAAGSLRQLGAIIASGNRSLKLRDIRVPTVVIHGKADKLVAPSGGRATAKAIPGAKLVLIPGMGHDLPRGAWPDIIGAIADNASRAGQRTSAAV